MNKSEFIASIRGQRKVEKTLVDTLNFDVDEISEIIKSNIDESAIITSIKDLKEYLKNNNLLNPDTNTFVTSGAEMSRTDDFFIEYYNDRVFLLLKNKIYELKQNKFIFKTEITELSRKAIVGFNKADNKLYVFSYEQAFEYDILTNTYSKFLDSASSYKEVIFARINEKNKKIVTIQGYTKYIYLFIYDINTKSTIRREAYYSTGAIKLFDDKIFMVGIPKGYSSSDYFYTFVREYNYSGDIIFDSSNFYGASTRDRKYITTLLSNNKIYIASVVFPSTGYSLNSLDIKEYSLETNTIRILSSSEAEFYKKIFVSLDSRLNYWGDIKMTMSGGWNSPEDKIGIRECYIKSKYVVVKDSLINLVTNEIKRNIFDKENVYCSIINNNLVEFVIRDNKLCITYHDRGVLDE